MKNEKAEGAKKPKRKNETSDRKHDGRQRGPKRKKGGKRGECTARRVDKKSTKVKNTERRLKELKKAGDPERSGNQVKRIKTD